MEQNKLKLEDCCLTIEQAKELQKLGIDFSNSSLCFDRYDELHIGNAADLKPFDKVLVRNFSDSKWMANFFRNYNDDDDTKFRYMCITGDYNQCLPYNDETKDLLCTTGNAPEKYKVW